MLGTRGLSREDYFAELATRLRRTIGSDATCWHTLDPQTGLLTSDDRARPRIKLCRSASDETRVHQIR